MHNRVLQQSVTRNVLALHGPAAQMTFNFIRRVSATTKVSTPQTEQWASIDIVLHCDVTALFCFMHVAKKCEKYKSDKRRDATKREGGNFLQERLYRWLGTISPLTKLRECFSVDTQLRLINGQCFAFCHFHLFIIFILLHYLFCCKSDSFIYSFNWLTFTITYHKVF